MSKSLLAYALAVYLAVPTALIAIGAAWWEDHLPAADRRPEPPSIVALDPDIGWLEMDLDVLADVALGEDPNALHAVMWTVLNRRSEALAGRRWDSTPIAPILEQVVQSGRAYGTMWGGSFRPAWSQDPAKRWRYQPRRWQTARHIALIILTGHSEDPTGGATHFHRRFTWRPPWAPDRAEWIDVGSHHFYQV